MEITITNMNTEITDKALNKELTNIKRAVEAGNKASWTVASAFHNIVVGELFTTDFGSLGNLAQAIGVSKSVISRNVNGYAIASKLSLMHWTLASVIELLPICSKYPIEELNKICQHLQAEGVPSRNKVRDYVKQLLTQDTAPAEEDTEPTEEDTEVVDTQSRVDELEALRAEVERLRGVCAKLRQENDKAHDIIIKEREQFKEKKNDAVSQAYDECHTFKVAGEWVILPEDIIVNAIAEYMEGVELDA